jgi:chitinase
VLTETADYINIMAYDMHGPWEPLTDHHAPLYKRDWDTDETNNIDAVVQYWKDSGMPSSKLMLGIPLYGKSWTLDYTYTEDPTLPAPGLGPGAAGPLTNLPGTLGYNEICNYVKNENWAVVVDPTFQIGPYASTPSVPKTWVGYDDPVMANVKSRYVLDRGLGGAMVWDMSTDDFRNTCGDGPNPIMTNISRTVGVTTSTTTTSPAATTTTTTASTSTTTGETTTTTPTTPRPPTTKLSTWPRVTTQATTQATSSKTPFMPNDGHRIAGNSQQLTFLAFGFILINLVI